MPKTSDITFAPAPKGWKPTPDEAGDIAGDPQLQRMSRDEQYHYFKNRKGGSSGSSGGSSTPARKPAAQPAKKPAPAKGQSIFGAISEVLNRANKKD